LDDQSSVHELEQRIALQAETIRRQHHLLTANTLALASREEELGRLREALARIAALEPVDSGTRYASGIAKQATRPRESLSVSFK
jgi:uncharacterized coiled-coil protein SlyX